MEERDLERYLLEYVLIRMQYRREQKRSLEAFHLDLFEVRSLLKSLYVQILTAATVITPPPPTSHCYWLETDFPFHRKVGAEESLGSQRRSTQFNT